ncbi:unnamed protein product, partial [Arctogadus glacialis]
MVTTTTAQPSVSLPSTDRTTTGLKTDVQTHLRAAGSRPAVLTETNAAIALRRSPSAARCRLSPA